MKHELRKLIVRGLVACALMVGLGFLGAWILDTRFNGFVMDGLRSLVSGIDQASDAVFFSQSAVLGLGVRLLLAVSVLISAVGVICAYRAYRREHLLLERSQAQSARAKQLAETEAQRKSDLITYLAHDLRTPLSSVVAYLNLLSECPEISAEQRAKYTSIALNKANRLEQLIEELFEIIRFNLQNIELNLRPVRLRLMLMQLSDEFYPLTLPNHNPISLSCPENLTLRCDPDKMARVLNNLLKNALSYSTPDSPIEIAAQADARGLTLVFANAGAEIPQAQLERVFDKFYRLDAARSSQTGGAGLGLAISKEIVEAHGGSISAHSADGHTQFIVTLPTALCGMR